MKTTTERQRQMNEFNFLYSPRHYVRRLEDMGMNPLLIPVMEKKYVAVYEDARRLLNIKTEIKNGRNK